MFSKYNIKSLIYKIFPLFFSGIITVLLYFFINNKLSFFWDLDDICMRNIISGIYSGAPDGYVYFMKLPLTYLISSFYNLVPDVYWLLLFFKMINFFCIFLIFLRIIKKNKKLIPLLVIIFFLLILPRIIYLKWTTTAAIAMSTAIFFHSTMENKNKIIIILEYCIIFILLLISYNIRYTVFFLLLPFYLLTCFSNIINAKTGHRKKILFYEILFLIIICFFCFISGMIHSVKYSTNEWREYKEFTTYRSMLNDNYGFPIYEKYTDLYKSAGISKEMFNCLTQDYDYFLSATNSIDSNSIALIANKAKELYTSGKKEELVVPTIPGTVTDLFATDSTFSSRLKRCINVRIKAAISKDYKDITIIYFIMFVILLFGFLIKKNYLNATILIISIIGFECLWIILYYKGRLPSYVGYTLYLGEILLLLAEFIKVTLTSSTKDLSSKKINNAIFSILIIITLILSIKQFFSINKEVRTNNITSDLRVSVLMYCEEHYDNYYIRDYRSMSYFENAKFGRLGLGNNYGPYVTWTCNYPHMSNRISLKENQNMCDWIKEHDNVYLIVNDERLESVCERQRELFLSNGIVCDFKKIDEISVNQYKINILKYVCN